MGAWRAWMKAATDAEGIATASGIAQCERFDDLPADEARRLTTLFDAATAALAAEDASLRAAYAHPRWAFPSVPPERRAARGLGAWVHEHALVHVIHREWVRHARVARDDTERGRGRPDLLVFDEMWRPTFAVEARHLGEGDGAVVLDAGRSSSPPGAHPLLMTFLRARRRELEPALRAATLDEALAPIHLGVFPCEVFTRWSAPAWREPGAFALLTFATEPSAPTP